MCISDERGRHRYTIHLLYINTHGHLHRRLTVRWTYCYPIPLGVHIIYLRVQNYEGSETPTPRLGEENIFKYT